MIYLDKKNKIVFGSYEKMSTSLTATLVSICINVDPPITLPNTVPLAPPVVLSGKYVAFPEVGSDPRSYKLHKADQAWTADPTANASVFIVINSQGYAVIS
jgi:hypothetical protein